MDVTVSSIICVKATIFRLISFSLIATSILPAETTANSRCVKSFGIIASTLEPTVPLIPRAQMEQQLEAFFKLPKPIAMPNPQTLSLKGSVKFNSTVTSNSGKSVRSADSDEAQIDLIFYSQQNKRETESGVDIDTTKAFGQLRFSFSNLNVINSDESPHKKSVQQTIGEILAGNNRTDLTVQQEHLIQAQENLLADNVLISADATILVIRKEMHRTGNSEEVVFYKKPGTDEITEAKAIIKRESNGVKEEKTLHFQFGTP